MCCAEIVPILSSKVVISIKPFESKEEKATDFLASGFSWGHAGEAGLHGLVQGGVCFPEGAGASSRSLKEVKAMLG